MPGKHTAKEKRMAKHIAASYRKSGVGSKEATSRGYATVNARKGKGRSKR
jgi:hypothetical protein